MSEICSELQHLAYCLPHYAFPLDLFNFPSPRVISPLVYLQPEPNGLLMNENTGENINIESLFPWITKDHPKE